jgi:hypothetical protein
MNRTDYSFPSPSGLDRILAEEMRGLGDDAELAFAAVARKATGRMARNIKAHARGATIEITVFARNPTSGFDYVAVTRFGHKVEWIYPRADRVRRPAYVLATKRKRATGRNAALRFVLGGRVIYARRVRAFQPDHDWADDAMPTVQRAADEAMARVKRRIELQR